MLLVQSGVQPIIRSVAQGAKSGTETGLGVGTGYASNTVVPQQQQQQLQYQQQQQQQQSLAAALVIAPSAVPPVTVIPVPVPVTVSIAARPQYQPQYQIQGQQPPPQPIMGTAAIIGQQSTSWTGTVMGSVAPATAISTSTIAAVPAPIRPIIVQTSRQLPPGWVQMLTADGRIYYVNHNNKSTHWELPPGY